MAADMQLIYNETVQGKTCCIVGHSMGGALAVHLSYLVGNSGLGNFGFSIYFTSNVFDVLLFKLTPLRL